MLLNFLKSMFIDKSLMFWYMQILVHSGKLQEAEILQRKILHILEMLQVLVL